MKLVTAKYQSARKLLRESEELYYAVVQQMAEAIFVFDVETKRIIEINPAAERLLGYSADELKELTIYDYIDHKKNNINFLMERVLKEKQFYHGVRRYIRKDGSIVHVEVNAEVIKYGGRNMICVVARDITERLQNEEALYESEQKLRQLSYHLLNIQEKERKRISKELHDELGQALLVLKFQIKSIQDLLSDNNIALKESCKKIQAYLDQIIENVRRISRDLSPSILEDLGLSSALRLLIKEITDYYKIETKIELPEIDKLFSQKSQIVIYRIFQEVLTNLVKHAAATKLSVAVKKRINHIEFVIADNGVGFDIKREFSKDTNLHGMGLATMSERVKMLGGTFNISSEKGTGTQIVYQIPIEFILQQS